MYGMSKPKGPRLAEMGNLERPEVRSVKPPGNARMSRDDANAQRDLRAYRKPMRRPTAR